MKYISFITESCRKSAKRYGIVNDIENQGRKVIDDQSIASWDRFLPSPYIKKDMGRDWRLVAEKRTLKEQDTIVIVFVEVFSRGDRTYNTFFNNPEEYYFHENPTEEELINYINDPDTPHITELPSPSAKEYEYLYSVLESEEFDGVVYESKDWVDKISTAEELAWCYELVAKAVDKKGHGIQTDRHQEYGILFKHFPEKDALFLIGLFKSNSPGEERLLRSKYEDALTNENLSNEELLRLSRRAYPSLILADPALWRVAQRNEEANLALSVEESGILESITNSHSTKLFPLFINGRPGSGKSTILQYLFAEYLSYYIREAAYPGAPPIYLTYSENLLNWAKQTVKSLVSCNAKRLFNSQANDEVTKQFEAIAGKCFGEFHQFLLSYLPPEVKPLFQTEKRVDFADFKALWNKHLKSDPNADIRRLSPELAWHIIRTFVKGMRGDSNNYLSPDSYEDLPKTLRTVTRETYQLVFSRIWENWYRPLCTTEGYWDNQDLARTILDLKNTDYSNHPAVFCDEAQDFTRIELELILKLSLFSRRKLQIEELRRVPFAFAGDPFQTLNPTGFDWGSVQAGFHEKIVQELDPSYRGNLEFNYHELQFNYRSTQSIVKFCNAIQLLRGVLFYKRGLKPQRTWFDQDSHFPVYFDIEDETCQRNLREQSELVIILPCQEGEENEFIAKDPYLKDLAKSEIRNFLSPIAAKGLEFSRVVLYKFGESFLANYQGMFELLDRKLQEREGDEALLPYEYFLNRLYVAASRPKKRLFVVDTKEGIDKFWRHELLNNPENLIYNYDSNHSGVWQKEDLTIMNPGNESSWSDDRDDPLVLGKQFLQEGIDLKDSYKLRLAAGNFRRAEHEQDALKCDAIRHEVDGEFKSAGKIYVSLNDTKSALRCFWIARDYESIVKEHSFEGRPEHRSAAFQLGRKTKGDCLGFLGLLEEMMNGQNRSKILSDVHWKELFNSLLIAIDKETFEGPDSQLAFNRVVELYKGGLRPQDERLFAKVAFLAGEFKLAVSSWEESGLITGNELYFHAKAETEEYPECITWLVKLARYDEIIRQFDRNKNLPLSFEEAKSVIDAFVKFERLEDAYKLAAQHDSVEIFKTLLVKTKQAKNFRLAVKIAESLVTLQERRAVWQEAIKEINDKFWKSQERIQLSYAFVSALAISEKLASAPPDTQSQISDFLRPLSKEVTKDLTHLQNFGGAIERTGRIVDALEFYEYFWKTKSLDSSLKESARKRWLFNKYKFVEYFEEREKPGDAERQRRDAEHYKKIWNAAGWTDELSEFPEVTERLIAIPESSNTVKSTNVDEEITVLTADQKKAIRAMIKAGMTAKVIASLLNISEHNVDGM